MVCQLCHLKSSVDYRGGYEIVDNFSQSDSEIIRFDSVSPTHDNLISMFPDDVSVIVTKVGAEYQGMHVRNAQSLVTWC